MKVLLIVVGSVLALYGLFAIIQFIHAIFTSPATEYGVANLAAAFLPVLLGVGLSVACFHTALRKRKAKGEPQR